MLLCLRSGKRAAVICRFVKASLRFVRSVVLPKWEPAAKFTEVGPLPDKFVRGGSVPPSPYTDPEKGHHRNQDTKGVMIMEGTIFLGTLIMLYLWAFRDR